MKPIFILGHPKSGTSLVNSLLDSHPELMVLPEESDFYLSIWPKAKSLNLKWRWTDQKKIDSLYEHIITITHYKNYVRGKVDNDISGNLDYEDFPVNDFKTRLHHNIGRALNDGSFIRRDLMLNLLETFKDVIVGDTSQKKFWVEKTPKHTWHLNEILEDFPQTTFVFVHRDPRDNYVSFRKKLGEELTPLRFAKSWNEAASLADTIPSSNRVHWFKYEDLINSGETETNKLADFMGIERSKTMLAPTKLSKTWAGNSMFNISSNKLHNSSIGRYREVLAKDDIEIIEYFCHKRMTQLGYELSDAFDYSSLKSKLGHLQEAYDAFFPFGKLAPQTFRSKLGILRRRVWGA